MLTRSKRQFIKKGNITVPVYAMLSHGKTRYQVPVYVDGKRKRRTFSDGDEARAFATAVATGQENEHGVLARMKQEELRAACLLAGVLGPFVEKHDLTLEQAVREYCAAKELAGTLYLPQIVTDYMAQPWVTKSLTPIKDAIVAFLCGKREKGCRTETLRGLHYALQRLARSVGADTPIGAITRDQLRAEIHKPGHAPRTAKHYYCEFHSFYAWLKRNGYFPPGVPTAMDQVETVLFDAPPPAVVTVETAKDILKILVDKGEVEFAVVVAISLFGGVRADEVQRLRWEDVVPGERINVPAYATKGRIGRPIPIQPVLDAWLRPFYGRKGIIVRMLDPQIHIADILEGVGIAWKRNWLRHSYCSYRLAYLGDIAETARECGNSPAVLARHYLELVTKGQAEAYFSLTPEACGIENWTDTVASYARDYPECNQRATKPKSRRLDLDNIAAWTPRAGSNGSNPSNGKSE